MAYLPNSTRGPNGGRVNISMAGNTANAGTMISSGTVFLSGGNNIVLSQNGNSIGLSSSQSTFTQNLTLGGNTMGVMAQVSSGVLTLAGGSNITLSQAANAVTISHAPGTSTFSRWEYPTEMFTSLGVVGQGSLSLQHIYVPHYVTGASMKIGGSLTASTNIAAADGSISQSLWIGIYTLNGSTLARVSSGSANNNLTFGGNIGNAGNNTSVTGMRQLTVPMNVNMTPGEYWIGAVLSTSWTGSDITLTLYGNNQIAAAAANAAISPIGSNTTVAGDVMLFQGIHKTASYTMPASIQHTEINNTGASVVGRANFYHAIYNATF